MDEITISKVEYIRLQRRECLLDAMEAAGVDNWGGEYHTEYRQMLKERGLMTPQEIEEEG